MSKASKHLRECPAAGRGITSRECGEGRHSVFSCPAECPYDPFSAENYDQFSEIELRVITKAMDYFKRENRHDTALMDGYRKSVMGGIGENTAFCLWHFFWRRDANGLTMADRWEKRRFDGLGNDERVMLAGHRQARPALVEIRRIVDDTLVECVDLFSGERFMLADRSLASSAARFDALFAWLIPQPHFCRFLGHATIMPEVGPLEPREILLGVAQQLGAPAEPEALLRWLAEHWARMDRALGETKKALHRDMLAHMGAKFYRTDYLLKDGPRRLQQKLAKVPGLGPEPLADEEQRAGFTEGFLWLEQASELDPAQPDFPSLAPAGPSPSGTPILGRVLLGANMARIETSSTAHNGQMRSKFEQIAAGLVEFHSEKITDMGAQMAAEVTYDAAVVPPQFFEHAPRVIVASTHLDKEIQGDREELQSELVRQHRQQWIDERIPSLDGRTPREAAAIPALRARLISLVKSMVRRADRESAESSEQATQLIATLGLEEIAEPTPPERLGYGDVDDDVVDDDEPIDLLDAGIDFPNDDPPVELLSDAEIVARVEALNAAYPLNEPGKLDNAFAALAGDLIDLFEDTAVPYLREREQDCLYFILVRLYFVLVPTGTARGEIDPERFRLRQTQWILRFTKAMSPAFDEPEMLFQPLQKTRQPLVAIDAVEVMASMEGKKRKEQTRMEVMPIILSFIAAAVDELDCAVMQMRR